MARRLTGGRRSRSERSGPAGAAGPDREAILKFIAENPDRANKRDIAKAFGVRGQDRIGLKAILRELESEGLFERRGKRLVRAGALPPVTLVDVIGRDEDGGLIGLPADRDEDDGESPRISILNARGGSGATPGVGDRVLARIEAAPAGSGADYLARPIKVLEKRGRSALGVVRRRGDGTFFTEPVERRQPELLLDGTRMGDAREGDLVEVEPLRSTGYGPPRGKVISVVGSIATEKAVSMIAIHAHDIPYIFSAAAIEEAEAARPVSLDGREDWRQLGLVTIDPADAKDHDDAVHGALDDDPANPGGVIVTVAIADVAAYVRPGGALDREALKRGNSVYFPDRVVPMLPERISNDLCSLREGEDRPALAVRMVFAADGRKIRHAFHRILMRSAARLSYPQAQAAIDGSADSVPASILDTLLQPLWSAWRVLDRGRGAREPLEIDLPERKILLRPDGSVDRVVIPPRLEAHRLIEEMMIQANVCAAETLEARRQALVYRVHDSPSLAKQESLRDFLGTVNLSLARGAQLRPQQFNRILEQVRGAEHETLVNEVVLRSQSQAEYNPQNIGHFGLNLRRYAHFTSPIRRYADLIVHRALIAALGLGDDGLTAAEESRLADTAALISSAERRAMTAERDTVDRLIAMHLSARRGETFEARIAGVAKAGLFVRLNVEGANGFVPVSTLAGDYYIYDETGHLLFGERTGKGWRLGDVVEVRLVEAAPMAGSLVFEMLSDPRQLPGMKTSYHKASLRRGARSQRAVSRGVPRGGRRKR